MTNEKETIIESGTVQSGNATISYEIIMPEKTEEKE